MNWLDLFEVKECVGERTYCVVEGIVTNIAVDFLGEIVTGLVEGTT